MPFSQHAGLASHEWGELDSRDFVTAVTLGSNVLRAETAAMAALAIVGSDFGDDLTRGTGEMAEPRREH